MTENDRQNELRRYLLGEIGSEELATPIEKRLLTDDDYFDESQMVVDEMFQEYADGKMDDRTRKQFESRFLGTDEGRRKLKFAKNLRKYVDNEETLTEPEKKQSLLKAIAAFFMSPIPAFAAFVVIAGIAGFVIWKNYQSPSEITIALNSYQKNGRPTDGRISDLDYAPKTEGTRGNSDSVRDKYLRFAEAEAAKRVLENPTAEDYHELGKVFLAKREFDKAAEQLQKAVELSPNDPKIRNDLGVAWLEKPYDSGSERLKNLDKAQSEFDQALELEPSFPDALFNKARCLELIPLNEEAKAAWINYLKIDSTSPWADEARKRLELLQSTILNDTSPEEVESQFLSLFKEGNDEKAFLFVSQNRELIKEKYLPQRLAMSYVNSAPIERKEKLRALKYIGKIEKERLGDYFAADLAAFYEDASEEKIARLKTAQDSVRKGYAFFSEDNFDGALIAFNNAMKTFLSVGNIPEADAICKHFIGYIYYFTNRRPEAVRLFDEVNSYCLQKQYKWFQLMNFFWLTGGQERLGLRPTSEVKKEYEIALNAAESFKDAYMTQKYLQNLALRSDYVRQEKSTLDFLARLLDIDSEPNISIRQKFRNLNSGVEMLVSCNLTALSKSAVVETVRLAEASNDKLFLVDSKVNSGTVFTKTRDFDEAESWFKEARRDINNLGDGIPREEPLSKLSLKWGHLERERGNFQESTELYDEAIATYQKRSDAPQYLYEALKSRLLSFQALQNDDEVGIELPAVLEMAKQNRESILDEQERHSFFDNQQTIYDVAVEHEIRKGRNERAFDYAELSNSRSLLDWLQKGANISSEQREVEGIFKETSEPISIEQIRRRIPANVQILQFTVLEKKVLLWLITKDKFILASSEIEGEILREKVAEYLSLIKANTSESKAGANELGRFLFGILIAPLRRDLDGNKKLCIVPNKSLFHLPFTALISPEGKYLVEDFSLSFAPSSNVFIICTENAARKSGSSDERILSIGNPKFDSGKNPGLGDLPSAEAEAKEVAGFYPSAPVVLTNDEATRNAFLSKFKDFEVINIAAHYVVQPDAPLQSRLIFAEDPGTNKSFLTNLDFVGTRLNKAKLVVLSACQTGVEGYYNGEGLIGLSRTFLAMGVPLVVASEWKTDSEATSQMIRKFHYYRREAKLSTTDALRESQLDMLGGTDERYRAPYYWAAFAVFGGYANF